MTVVSERVAVAGISDVELGGGGMIIVYEALGIGYEDTGVELNDGGKTVVTDDGAG